jgi:hypothetical protein
MLAQVGADVDLRGARGISYHERQHTAGSLKKGWLW